MRVRPEAIEVVDDSMADVLRQKSGQERLRIANGLYAFARRLLLNVLAAEHPDWNQQQINHEAARRLSHGAV